MGVLALPGCVATSSSDAVKQLPTDLAEHASVSDIDIGALPPNVSADFKGKLEAALRSRLSECAHGDHALRLSVTVEKFSGENAAMTILAGSSNVIKGSAKLIEPADGSVVGDFDIAHSVGGGGVFAAIGMAGAESKMADAFATELCTKAFDRAR
jgi:hypothetical protein